MLYVLDSIHCVLHAHVLGMSMWSHFFPSDIHNSLTISFSSWPIRTTTEIIVDAYKTNHMSINEFNFIL